MASKFELKQQIARLRRDLDLEVQAHRGTALLVVKAQKRIDELADELAGAKQRYEADLAIFRAGVKAINASAPEAPKRGRAVVVEPEERLAFSVREFCESQGFSVGHYYNLRKLGKTPRTMDVAGRVLISREAIEDWKREREAETSEGEN